MELKNKYPGVNIAVLLVSMIFCGLLSVSFGKELQWDLAGYHFYNPYAFLHQRFNTLDYWAPSAIQMYITPTLDFFSYYIIKSYSPKMCEFMLGSIHGINAALLFYISRFFLAFFVKRPIYQIIIAALAAVTGLYAPTVFPGIGAFFNDNTISLFILGFVLWWVIILKKYNECGTFSSIQIMGANLLLGVAVGCKLTEGIYVIGSFAGLVMLPLSIRDKIVMMVYSTLGISLGFILADGYWMWFLWKQYQNFFFPFFNGLFHSPYFPPVNWSEPRYLPHGMIENLFFPFYFSTGHKPTAELYFTDFRFVIVYLLFIVFALSVINQRKRIAFKPAPIIWLYIFFIFSYLAWQACFSIMRYLGVLQMLAPLVCLLLVFQITDRVIDRLFSSLLILVFILNTMHPIRMERSQHFGADYFNVKLPAFVQEQKAATVLLAYSYFAKSPRPRPNHYLIPFFPSGWRFSGIPLYRNQYEIPSGVRAFLHQSPQPVYLLAASDDMPSLYKAAKELHLQSDGACSNITSDRQQLTHETILLCPMRTIQLTSPG